MAIDFQFKDYVERRKSSDTVDRGDFGAQYAYSGDLKAMEMLRKLKPVTLAVEATIRMGKDLLKNDMLGSAVKVTPNQFPKLHAVVQRCAETLAIPVPAVYISQSPYLNASTYGTPEDSFILLHSALVDHFTDEELAFVIGHECGHIHNGHVVFLTAAHYLRSMASFFLRWIATPALYALNAWSRRAEITCDRAGLLVVKDVDLAIRCIIKLAVGSQRLYEQINPEEYLKQLEEGRQGLGRISEASRTHPYHPKRVEALRLFAETETYLGLLGRPGGKAREEVDARIAEILSVT
jgi:Zn-dependent protease with chaperone function